jgi:histidinol dehydrogenase
MFDLFITPRVVFNMAFKQCIGTNHVLPTRKASRYTGGLWVGKYLRTVTYQEVTSPEASGELGRLCGRAARAENFEGHARSGDLRAFKHLKDDFQWISRPEEAEQIRPNL